MSNAVAFSRLIMFTDDEIVNVLNFYWDSRANFDLKPIYDEFYSFSFYFCYEKYNTQQGLEVDDLSENAISFDGNITYAEMEFEEKKQDE